MSATTIRQGQLITPFGTGAMHVSSEGISLVAAGLDYWFQADYIDEDHFFKDEFIIEEPRLQRVLNVNFFYAPPDFRKKDRYDDQATNKEITIPFFRFPRTYFCQKCNYIQTLQPTDKSTPECRECKSTKMVPVPLVAICDHGHAQEFPWNAWVHKTVFPSCEGNRLYFKNTGIPGLAGLQIECKDCGKKQHLAGVTSATSPEQTFLSDNLSENEERYLCKGEKPWLHYSRDSGCSRPLRASLRSAGNLYFPVVRSAIHIPSLGIPKRLQGLLSNNSNLTSVLDFTPNVSVERLKEHFQELNEFSDEDINKAVNIYLSEKKGQQDDKSKNKASSEIQYELRLEEYSVLSEECNAEDLKVRKANISKYSSLVRSFFSSVCLVERLRETRALTGFSRVFPDTDMGPQDLQRLMWDTVPPRGKRWLPANIIYGEGIFLCLDQEKLQKWEAQDSVVARIKNLQNNYAKAQEVRKLGAKEISPRFVLIHTLAHLLINQMTYEAGYSSASLRERLYVSEQEDGMCSLLIYTAAGDSDGTMGGLVHLGEAGFLEPTLEKAIENARWCSADPICMEMGRHGGQGPDNCNLAVCHNCGLVPETACEEFNRFLDRGLVVGDEQNSEMGFFNEENG